MPATILSEPIELFEPAQYTSNGSYPPQADFDSQEKTTSGRLGQLAQCSINQGGTDARANKKAGCGIPVSSQSRSLS
jgi:hypothetical protein